MRNFLALCAAAVLWAGMMVGQASAAVVNMADVPGPYDLNDFNNIYFFGQSYGTGGGESLSFEFEFSPAPTSAQYKVTLNQGIEEFDDFQAVWSTDLTVGNADDIALTIGAQTVQLLTSSPVFLLLTWTGSDGVANLDLSVQAVPIPASILMLLSGLLGLGFLGRYARRRTSQAL